MPNHELAFSDIMASLLSQTPDRADDPPVQQPADSADVADSADTQPATTESHDELVMQAILGVPDGAEVVEKWTEQLERVQFLPDYDEAVARFLSKRGA